MTNVITKKFEAGGECAITTAANGKIGLQLLGQKKYDLILLDLVEPILDGFKTLKGIKKIGIKTPVMIITNQDQEKDRHKALSLGAIDCSIKGDSTLTEMPEIICSQLF